MNDKRKNYPAMFFVMVLIAGFAAAGQSETGDYHAYDGHRIDLEGVTSSSETIATGNDFYARDGFLLPASLAVPPCDVVAKVTVDDPHAWDDVNENSMTFTVCTVGMNGPSSIVPNSEAHHQAGHSHMNMTENSDGADVIYTCPMHPEIQSDEPGKCSKCGMDLEPKKKEKGRAWLKLRK